MSKTNNIALYIQENGYDESDCLLLDQLEDFTSYDINIENKDNNFISYHITTKFNYSNFSNIFNYFSKEIICEITVYRKEI